MNEQVYVCHNEWCEDYGSPRPEDEVTITIVRGGGTIATCPECAWEMDIYEEEED